MKTTGILGLLTAFASSLCCIAPLLALASGGLGSIASSLTWLESVRPYTIALSVGTLGWAWYVQLKSKPATCPCDTARSPFWQTKRFLGSITGLALLLLAFPVYSDWQGQDNQLILNRTKQFAGNQQVAYVTIKGMTCSGCEQHVNGEVSKLKGIADVKVSYAQANAIVRFDPGQTSADAIRKAVASTGYKVMAVKTSPVK